MGWRWTCRPPTTPRCVRARMATVDNVPLTLFRFAARADMLPGRMWGMPEGALDVRVAAVSGTLIGLAFAPMLVMERLIGPTRRMRG